MNIYPINLKCEYQKNPVVDKKDLRFNWQIKNTAALVRAASVCRFSRQSEMMCSMTAAG